jgi:hypothetical protein
MAAVAPPLKKSPSNGSAAVLPSPLGSAKSGGKDKSLDEKLTEAVNKLRDRIDGPIWGRFEEVATNASSSYSFAVFAFDSLRFNCSNN